MGSRCSNIVSGLGVRANTAVPLSVKCTGTGNREERLCLSSCASTSGRSGSITTALRTKGVGSATAPTRGQTFPTPCPERVRFREIRVGSTVAVMAGWDDVRRAALAMPETSEGESRGLRGWSVRKKGFVWERPLRKADVAALGSRRAGRGDPGRARGARRREGRAARDRAGRVLHDAALRRLPGGARAARRRSRPKRSRSSSPRRGWRSRRSGSRPPGCSNADRPRPATKRGETDRTSFYGAVVDSVKVSVLL